MNKAKLKSIQQIRTQTGSERNTSQQLYKKWTTYTLIAILTRRYTLFTAILTYSPYIQNIF